MAQISWESKLRDGAERIRQDLEVDRLSVDLADRLGNVSPDAIEDDVRAEFNRWSSAPVQDFVPIFVERTLRKTFGA